MNKMNKMNKSNKSNKKRSLQVKNKNDYLIYVKPVYMLNIYITIKPPLF